MRSKYTLGAGRKDRQGGRSRLNLAVAIRPRQAVVEIGDGRNEKRLWSYVCRAALLSVWRKEQHPQ
jgi:hypothetical protein